MITFQSETLAELRRSEYCIQVSVEFDIKSGPYEPMYDSPKGPLGGGHTITLNITSVYELTRNGWHEITDLYRTSLLLQAELNKHLQAHIDRIL